MNKRIENQGKKKDIIAKYNLTSHFYDKRYSEIQQLKFDILLRALYLNERIILDAGCGTGKLFENIINSNKSDKLLKYFFVGSDISIKMLHKFKDRINIYKNLRISLLLCDLDNLPIRNNVFNLVFSVTSLQNLPNIYKGIQEIIRVSKNEAHFKCSILRKKLDLNRIVEFLKQYINKIELIDEKQVEDIIIQGYINKSSNH